MDQEVCKKLFIAVDDNCVREIKVFNVSQNIKDMLDLSTCYEVNVEPHPHSRIYMWDEKILELVDKSWFYEILYLFCERLERKYYKLYRLFTISDHSQVQTEGQLEVGYTLEEINNFRLL